MADKKPQSVLRGIGILLLGRIPSRLLGLVREVLTASLFGAGWIMDSYNLSLTIVSSLKLFFAEQLSVPINPIFFQRKNRDGEKAAFDSMRVITTFTTALSVIVSVLLLFFADVVIGWLTPGFDEQSRTLSILLLRCLAVGGAGVILHRYLSSLHTCFLRYNAVAFAPLTLNVIIILAMVFFGARVGIISLAAGTALGYLVYIIVLIIWLPRRSELLKPSIDFKDPGFRQFLWMLLPLYLAVSVEQAQLFIDRGLASHLPEGSLSAQGYALRLVRMFMDFMVAILVNVLFPVFSSLAQGTKRSEFSKQFSLTFQGILLILCLVGTVMVSLALPGVRTMLERGSFDFSASVRTADLVGFYFIAYGSQVLYLTFARGFNAHGDTRTPMITTIISVLVVIALDFALVEPMGIRGLALAQAVGYSLNAILMYILFARYIVARHHWKNLRISALGISLAVLLGWGVKQAWTWISATGQIEGFLPRTVVLIVVVCLAMAMFIFALKIFKIEAIDFLLKKFKNRSKIKPKA